MTESTKNATRLTAIRYARKWVMVVVVGWGRRELSNRCLEWEHTSAGRPRMFALLSVET